MGGIKEYDTNQTRTFTEKGEHTFYVDMPTDNNSGNNGNENGNNLFWAAEQEIKIKIKTDKYDAENTWELRSVATIQLVRQKGLKSYSPRMRSRSVSPAASTHSQ